MNSETVSVSKVKLDEIRELVEAIVKKLEGETE